MHQGSHEKGRRLQESVVLVSPDVLVHSRKIFPAASFMRISSTVAQLGQHCEACQESRERNPGESHRSSSVQKEALTLLLDWRAHSIPLSRRRTDSPEELSTQRSKSALEGSSGSRARLHTRSTDSAWMRRIGILRTLSGQLASLRPTRRSVGSSRRFCPPEPTEATPALEQKLIHPLQLKRF